MNRQSKQEQYVELVRQRKSCRLCSEKGFKNTSLCQYETDNIGKWTDWQNSLDAEILVVGQDWGTIKYWEDNKGIDTKSSRTNDALRNLLLILGYDIGTVFEPIPQKKLFFTNSVLCLKNGKMNASIPAKVYSNCVSNFLKPLTMIIKPKYIITLGSEPYKSVLKSDGYKTKDIKKLREAVGTEPILLSTGQYLFPVNHCGPLGQVNRRPDDQLNDWKKIFQHIQLKWKMT